MRCSTSAHLPFAHTQTQKHTYTHTQSYTHAHTPAPTGARRRPAAGRRPALHQQPQARAARRPRAPAGARPPLPAQLLLLVRRGRGGAAGAAWWQGRGARLWRGVPRGWAPRSVFCWHVGPRVLLVEKLLGSSTPADASTRQQQPRARAGRGPVAQAARAGGYGARPGLPIRECCPLIGIASMHCALPQVMHFDLRLPVARCRRRLLVCHGTPSLTGFSVGSRAPARPCPKACGGCAAGDGALRTDARPVSTATAPQRAGEGTYTL